jgi:hypothetical protein
MIGEVLLEICIAGIGSANVPRMTRPRVIKNPYDKTLLPHEGPHEKERMCLVGTSTNINGHKVLKLSLLLIPHTIHAGPSLPRSLALRKGIRRSV